jgi:hypothetical protein
MARRLAAFVGQPGVTHRHGYQGWVVGDAAVAAARRPLLAAAGLPDGTFVDPAEAVLAEWVVGATRGAATDPAFRGPVVVVACAEDTTVVDAFRVGGSGRPQLVRVADARRTVPHGIAPLRVRLVNEVLRRRSRRDLPVNVLALLAAAAEYGQQLADQPDRAIEWDGPLADQLISPLRLGQAELDDFTETRALVVPLRRAVDAAAAATGDPRRPTVVLGGEGAGWACLRRAAAGSERPVAWSADPELSLAAGAAYWSVVHRFARDIGPAGSGADPVPTAPVPDLMPPQQRRDRLPPWLAATTSGRDA